MHGDSKYNTQVTAWFNQAIRETAPNWYWL